MDGLSVLRVVFQTNLSPDFSYHDKIRGKEGESSLLIVELMVYPNAYTVKQIDKKIMFEEL